ncbi:MAG: hypothetical protein EOT05_00915 [Candidatus Microsaccharimonas sossegonensis]|uniref:Uncharacterized protein n=1 Tax=Candidatus Microsaccharimonas sossegonensis TaxID=2506948 RepID=A0A4Q0AGM9_9BACT|nr:MAG: hypothetical protein EOT05_00915 [Candidatus Microsaccharimonas sossegonensis]
MNLTIPTRAKSSTSSWSRQLRGSSSRKILRAGRKRYIFSIITAALLTGTVIAGSIGSVVQVASARDNFSPQNSHDQLNSPQNQSRGEIRNGNSAETKAPTPTNTKTQTALSSNNAPVQPATTTPARKPTPTASPSPMQTVTSQVTPVEPQTSKSVTPIDTAPASANITAAQAEKAPTPVRYTSAKLSDEARNRLLVFAGVTVLTGSLLYTMSFIGA